MTNTLFTLLFVDIIWLFGLCSFQVLTCLAWLVWREYLASLASIDASFFVASSEASQRCNSHPPDRQLAHETRASLLVFPLRVVLVSTVTVSKLYNHFSVSTFQGEFKFHSLKAMQDVHLCMYVCMYMYVCMCVCIYMYVSQGDFRLMSFTAGRCGTPLILNDQ